MLKITQKNMINSESWMRKFSEFCSGHQTRNPTGKLWKICRKILKICNWCKKIREQIRRWQNMQKEFWKILKSRNFCSKSKKLICKYFKIIKNSQSQRYFIPFLHWMWLTSHSMHKMNKVSLTLAIFSEIIVTLGLPWDLVLIKIISV